jgi:hypothetical protein
MGKTDEVKGTGVFRSFELKREKTEEKKEEEKTTTKTTSKEEEGVTKK